MAELGGMQLGVLKYAPAPPSDTNRPNKASHAVSEARTRTDWRLGVMSGEAAAQTWTVSIVAPAVSEYGNGGPVAGITAEHTHTKSPGVP